MCEEKRQESFSVDLKSILAGDYRLQYSNEVPFKPEIKELIDQGYVPLKNSDINRVPIFYRGPLMPISQQQNSTETSMKENDEPAFQLGRLLCLQNKSIAEAVLNNRISNLRTAFLQKTINQTNPSLQRGHSTNEATSKKVQLNRLADLLKVFNISKNR